MSSKLKVNNIIPSTGTQIGISTTGGGINLLTGTVVTGVVTATSFSGGVTGTSGSFSSSLDIADKIRHSGDTDTTIRFPDADTFSVETAGDERLRITSVGRVGIGTGVPASRLNLKLSARGTADFRITDSDTTSDVLRSGSQADGDGYLQLRTIAGAGNVLLDASGVSYINGGNFGVGLTNPGEKLSVNGKIEARSGNWFIARSGDNSGYAHIKNPETTGSQLAFNTSGEKMRITSTGLVGISTNAPSAALLDIATSSGSNDHLRLRRLSSDSNVATNWSLKPYAGNLYFREGGSSDKIYFDDSGDIIIMDGNLIIGTAGHGIDFSATANSSGTMENELLSDYEEGTWVPVYQNVNTPNYGHRSGRYTKIGRFVYLVCQISVDSGLDTSDGSTVNIGGFPFTGNSAHGSCLFTLGQYIDVMPDSTIDLFTNVRFNGNAVMLHEGRNNQDITYTQLNSSGNLQFACSYAL